MLVSRSSYITDMALEKQISYNAYLAFKQWTFWLCGELSGISFLSL